MITFEKQRVLVLAPHVDDETFGTGGIIQRFRDVGSDVKVIIATAVLSSYSKINMSSGDYSNYEGMKRMAELENALSDLGVNDGYKVLFYDETSEIKYHHKLDAMPQSDIISKLESEISKYKPTVLLISAPSTNQDHRTLREVVNSISRPHFYNGTIIEYEVGGEINFIPNFYVSLTDEMLDKKLSAAGQYRTQESGSDLYMYSVPSIKIRAEYRGRECGSKYAEAFCIIRMKG